MRIQKNIFRRSLFCSDAKMFENAPSAEKRFVSLFMKEYCQNICQTFTEFSFSVPQQNINTHLSQRTPEQKQFQCIKLDSNNENTTAISTKENLVSIIVLRFCTNLKVVLTKYCMSNNCENYLRYQSARTEFCSSCDQLCLL